MLSVHQAIEIRESILAYLKATFNFQDKEVHRAFYSFVNHPEDGLFKGPYLSLKLPFVKASEEDQQNIPLVIKPPWLPYHHQVVAWHRLSTREQAPQPTIITTGTGSGKTESFLYPILDYCQQNMDRRGIKAIILYPMNALATDQAKRLAEAIYTDPELKGRVTAGLFIGVGKDNVRYPKSMGQDHIIENRESILSSPPDILLTNFKMLDYGLMRSNYNDLWLHNYADTKLLQYLVLDELHTYDGAQGTDVANLIRRLKLKIDLPENHLCPVGTSATIGSGEEATEALSEYASRIFGEEVTQDCIVIEKRLTSDEYFGDKPQSTYLPRSRVLNDIKPLSGEGYQKYIDRQINLWQSDKDNLARDLMGLKIFKDLVEVVNRGKGIHSLLQVVRELTKQNKEFKAVSLWDDHYQFNPREALVMSLFALISEAKVIDPKSGQKSPFLYAQTQFWIREFSGVLRSIDEKPLFLWKEDIDQGDVGLGLPPWFCRECGASGWLGVKHDNKERFEKDIRDVYEKYFGNHKHIYLANRTSWYSQTDAVNTGYEASNVIQRFVDSKNLNFHPETADNRTDITAFRKLNTRGYNDHVCPECNTRNSLSIIGTRVSTLSSIAVSQILATDLDQHYLQQRKVLAFTNSVQDAAHQAGFIQARNFRFTFRASMQKIVNELAEPASLEELAVNFIRYWKAQADQTGDNDLKAYYYRFYPKDYIGKSSPEDYANRGVYLDKFIQEFDARIRWEIYSEFGYNALIGRTLEKTASSAVHFREEDIVGIWDRMQPWLQENTPSATITSSEFMSFLVLVLHRIRTRGAVSHEFLDKFRGNDLQMWDLNWMRDSRHFLNKKFGPRTRIPRLITNETETRGLLDSTFTQRTNWFHQYFIKCFVQVPVYHGIINEFYQALFKALLETEMVDVRQAGHQTNYALRPGKIYVNKDVEIYECNSCGHEVFTSHPGHDLTGGSCLNYRCTGLYHPSDKTNQDPNYYQLVYNRKYSPRIYAADHTGLLERKTRELLEIDFKTRPNFNSVNALVATSTLEMGIDIGSLNTVLNNAVPPLPSNFLQRVGRAGRSSGSALVLNFAKSQAHDLYYFKKPLDMMAGTVQTPGCYLEAKEILKRHFFAFCIDSWTREDPANHHIPINLKYLKIQTLDLESPDFFMNQILDYLSRNETQLLESFQSAYKKDVSSEVFDHLREELKNESFYRFYRQIFYRLQSEIRHIQKIRKEIDEQIKQRHLGVEDPERKELEQEKKNLGGIIMSIRKRNTLEHLTNVGALPNYAFPETGVTLTARVIGNRAEGSEQPPRNYDFEIVRSASQAIREFAPDNVFYSQGYRFLITGINTIDWSDESNFHKKRFCSKCDHIDLAEIASGEQCPKCGDESWAAASNTHTYARLLSVKSFNSQSEARIADQKDERDNVFYNLKWHFNFQNSHSYGAYVMKEIPFGIEFVKNVHITQGNLGKTEITSARKATIDDMEVPRHGFITCRHCGKSSSNIHQDKYKFHYGYCKHKEVEYDQQSDDVFEEVYFFRDLQTEALKILLPVQELNGESEVKMFQAGIELGLKKYFKGNPQHIQFANYREFNHTTQKFDRYLVLFDAIPGGTGYLEELFDKDKFSKLLEVAYQEIRDCSCQTSGKDGCYRCIYTYSNQFYRLELSRSRAEKRFKKIVDNIDDWENQTGGLGNLTNKGKIEESELEERFIRSLKRLADYSEAWTLGEVNEQGVMIYHLQYRHLKTSIVYHIQPQVSLGPRNGVEFHTRADFLFICTELILNGESVEDLHSVPRMAVYMDGYQYHASQENNRFALDFKKRKSISESHNHYSWTLTWDDMDLFDAGLESPDVIPQSDDLDSRLHDPAYLNSKNTLCSAAKRDIASLHRFQNSFTRMLEILKDPGVETESKKNLSLYLGFFQKKLFNPSYAPDAYQDAIYDNGIDNYCIRERTLNGWCRVDPYELNELFTFRIAVNIEQNRVRTAWELHHPDKINKEDWNTFWQLFNLLQFFEWEEQQEKQPVAQDTPAVDEYKLEDALELFDELYHPQITRLYQSGQLTSEKDEILLTSLVDENGNSLAEADFIIPDLKKVVDPFTSTDQAVFEKHGFQIITPETINTIK